MRHAKTVAAVVQREELLATRKNVKADLDVLQPTISKGMIDEMAQEGITLTVLQNELTSKGEEGLASLLAHDPLNNKVRVTKNKKCVAAILAAVKATLPTNSLANPEADKAV